MQTTETRPTAYTEDELIAFVNELIHESLVKEDQWAFAIQACSKINPSHTPSDIYDFLDTYITTDICFDEDSKEYWDTEDDRGIFESACQDLKDAFDDRLAKFIASKTIEIPKNGTYIKSDCIIPMLEVNATTPSRISGCGYVMYVVEKTATAQLVDMNRGAIGRIFLEECYEIIEPPKYELLLDIQHPKVSISKGEIKPELEWAKLLNISCFNELFFKRID
jgi:hypothetical protein